jgi:hypothetical protein
MWQSKEVITNDLESQLNTTRDFIDKCSEAYCDAKKEVSALEPALPLKFADVSGGANNLPEEEPPVKRARLSKGGPPGKRRRDVSEKEGMIPASRDKEGVIDEKWLEDRVKMEENEMLPPEEGAA